MKENTNVRLSLDYGEDAEITHDIFFKIDHEKVKNDYVHNTVEMNLTNFVSSYFISFWFISFSEPVI